MWDNKIKTCSVSKTANRHCLHYYSPAELTGTNGSLLWGRVKESGGSAELAANDFGKRSAGSEDPSHVVRQRAQTLLPHRQGVVSNALAVGQANMMAFSTRGH